MTSNPPGYISMLARSTINSATIDMRWFQPLQSIAGSGVIASGGSDHMQKIGSLRSVNPYNPFLGMWTTLHSQAKPVRWTNAPEETLSREQAIRFYTNE